jgi:hypothetical protein
MRPASSTGFAPLDFPAVVVLDLPFVSDRAI